MASVFKRLIGRIDAIADRPADPATLTQWRSSRRGGRSAAPIAGVGSAPAPPLAAEPDPGATKPRRRLKPPRPELEGQEAIDRILAEQRSRMRGGKRRAPDGGSGG